MKKLIYIAAFAMAAIVAACGGKDDDEQTQDYTSFVIRCEGDMSPLDARVTDLISAYHDSTWHKIAEHGGFTMSTNTNFMSEETILPTHVDSIYLFCTWDNNRSEITRSYKPYILQKNKKNSLYFPLGCGGTLEFNRSWKERYPN